MSGESIEISVRVIACMERGDCQSDCGEERGERRMREVKGREVAVEEKTVTLSIKISMEDERGKRLENPTSKECQMFLTLTLATALIFCLISAFIVLFACYRQWRQRRRKGDRGTSEEKVSEKVSNKPDLISDAGVSDCLSEMCSPSLVFISCRVRSDRLRKPATVRSVKRRDRMGRGRRQQCKLGQFQNSTWLEKEMKNEKRGNT